MSSVLSIEEFKENIMGIPGMVPDLSEPPTGCRFHPRCSKAMPVCKEREPSLFESETDHGAACWLLEVNES
jgi:peptide/nickel transport system ATP-binding protein